MTTVPQGLQYSKRCSAVCRRKPNSSVDVAGLAAVVAIFGAVFGVLSGRFSGVVWVIFKVVFRVGVQSAAAADQISVNARQCDASLYDYLSTLYYYLLFTTSYLLYRVKRTDAAVPLL
jgi:hypothetical protein